MQQHITIYYVLTRTVETFGWAKDQNIFVSENSHVAYQIIHAIPHTVR